jgi:hypothetical protein
MIIVTILAIWVVAMGLVLAFLIGSSKTARATDPFAGTDRSDAVTDLVNQRAALAHLSKPRASDAPVGSRPSEVALPA